MSLKIHKNQYAYDVKCPEDDDTINLVDQLHDDVRDLQLETCGYHMLEWSQLAINFIQDVLRAKYPSYDIKIEQTGRSGGWIEIHGIWKNADELREEMSAYKQRIIFNYIFPKFEELVESALKAWNAEMQYCLKAPI